MSQELADVYSIVVPTFNRASALTRNVRSLLTQETASPYEIIVVDNNSTDGTREKMRALAARAPEKLRYMTEHAQGVSAARNAGVLAARGGVIAFIDDDAVAHPGWLNALAQRSAGLIGRKDLFVVRSPHLVRSLLLLVISRIISLFDSRAINESRVFSDELECWRRLGYLQQSLLARLGRCRNVRPKATGMPIHPSRHQVGR